MNIPRIICFLYIIVVSSGFLLCGTEIATAQSGPTQAADLSHATVATLPLTKTLPTQLFLPWVAGRAPARLVIAAAHIDSAISGEGDEALLLWNIGADTQPLAGWQLATLTRQATFPLTSTLTLAPGQRLWCAAEATTFFHTFGETPACEWASDSDPTILNLTGKVPLANSGGHLYLRNAKGEVVDTLVYGDNAQTATGWRGVAAQLYTRGDVSSRGRSGNASTTR